jgi:cytoskeletal protein CcmA (bactofilin family)
MSRCGKSDTLARTWDDDCCKPDCCSNITVWRDLRFSYGFGESLVLRNLKVHNAAVVEGNLGTHNLLVDNDAVIRGDTKINGDAKIKGDLTVYGDEVIKGKLSAGSLDLKSIDLSGDAGIQGKLAVTGDGLFGGNVTVAGDETIKGKLIAGSIVLDNINTPGDATIGGKLLVSADSGIGGSLTVAGDETVKGKLTVGTLALNSLALAGDASVGGKFATVGDAAIGGNIIIAGDETVKGKLTVGTLNIGSLSLGDVSVSGKLAVTGDSVFSGALTAQTLDIKSNAQIEGTLEVDGNASLQGSQTTVTGSLIVPQSLTIGAISPGISGFIIDNSFTTSIGQSFIKVVSWNKPDVFGTPATNSAIKINAVSANFMDFQAKTIGGGLLYGTDAVTFNFKFDITKIPPQKEPYMTGIVGSIFNDTSANDQFLNNPLGFAAVSFFNVLKFVPSQDFLATGSASLTLGLVRNMNWYDLLTIGLHISWVWVNPSA